MGKWALLAALGLVAAASIFIGYLFISRAPEPVLLASGTIEATDVDVSFQIGGRVAEVLVDEGQAVKAGEVVARMDSAELLEQVVKIQAALEGITSDRRRQESVVELKRGVVEGQIAKARSEAEAQRIAFQRLKEGSRPQEIRVAEAELAQAEAQLVQRRADFARASELAKEGIIPQQQFDSIQAALRTSETLRDASSEWLALAVEGSRPEDIAEANARLQAAEASLRVAEAGRNEVAAQLAALDAARAKEKELAAQLETAKTQLGYSEIRSPLDGVALTKNIESGEVVSAGTPVLTIANIDELWMNVYIPETQTGLVGLGQAVRVRVDSFPDETFEGTVTYLSSESEFTPKTIVTQEERIKLVYRAKVSLQNSQQRLKPGMPADAEIVISPNALARAAADPPPARAAVPEPEPEPVPVAPPAPPPPSPPSHAVQVGAFSVSKNAEALAAELSKKYPAVFIDQLPDGPAFYRVRIGSLPDLQAARQLQKQLAGEGFRPFVILPDSSRP